MNDKTYNGWTNYATWRVNLEVFDGLELDLDAYFIEGEEPDAHLLAGELQDYAEEAIFCGIGFQRKPSNLMEDYARAFLQDVNFVEIAQHMLDDYAEELKA